MFEWRMKVVKITVADAYLDTNLWNRVNKKEIEVMYRVGHRPKIVEKIEKVNNAYYLHIPFFIWNNGIESIYDYKIMKVKPTKNLDINEVHIAKPRVRREIE